MRIFGNIKTFVVEFEIPIAEVSIQMEIRGKGRPEKMFPTTTFQFCSVSIYCMYMYMYACSLNECLNVQFMCALKLYMCMCIGYGKKTSMCVPVNYQLLM